MSLTLDRFDFHRRDKNSIFITLCSTLYLHFPSPGAQYCVWCRYSYLVVCTVIVLLFQGLWQRRVPNQRRNSVCCYLRRNGETPKDLQFPGRASFPHQQPHITHTHTILSTLSYTLQHSLLHNHLTFAYRPSPFVPTQVNRTYSFCQPQSYPVTRFPTTFSLVTTLCQRSLDLLESSFLFTHTLPDFVSCITSFKVAPRADSPQWASALSTQYASNRLCHCATFSEHPPISQPLITQHYYQHAVLDQ